MLERLLNHYFYGLHSLAETVTIYMYLYKYCSKNTFWNTKLEASDFLKALRSLVEQAWCCPRFSSLTVLVPWRCFSLVLGHCEVSLKCLLRNRSKQSNVQVALFNWLSMAFPYGFHCFKCARYCNHYLQADIANRMEERQKRLGGVALVALVAHDPRCRCSNGENCVLIRPGSIPESLKESKTHTENIRECQRYSESYRDVMKFHVRLL